MAPATVARDAAIAAAAQGHLQLASGKAGPLERVRGGDGFVLYSPRECARDFPCDHACFAPAA